MDRQRFEDDSSAALGLSHGPRGETEEERAERLMMKMQSDTHAYRKGILDAGLADWIIAHLKADPKSRDLRPSEVENLALDRYLSIRGGAHERVRTYVEIRHMDLQAAIIKAESDLTRADESEEQSNAPSGVKDEYLGASLDDLMDVHKKTFGGGSKSKSYKTVKRADAPAVEQAIRKQMTA